MAKSFKEIGKKAEALIEQGREADRNVQSCQARVASANSRVAAARRQLAAASETDEEGNPVGDVSYARAQLSMAENQLAASQRALSAARGDADRVQQQKQAHVHEIERHNQVERSNLEKLRKLRTGAFSADSAALTEGMARRLNEAEDTKAALLRSMGIEATADHVTEDSGGAADSGWRGGGFAALDVSGQAQGYRGGGSEGLPTGNSVAAPVGGGLTSPGIGIQNHGIRDAGLSEAEQVVSSTEATSKEAHRESSLKRSGDLFADYAEKVARAWADRSMPTEDRIAILSGFRNLLECYRQQYLAEGYSSQCTEPVKVLKKTYQQISDEGHRYIEGILDAYRENLLQRGVVDNGILDDCINSFRQQYTELLNRDLHDGTFNLYTHTIPDFEELANSIKQSDLRSIERRLTNEYGASVVQLDGFDPRVAHDMADALYEAKKDFPELNIQYFGSCQSQAASIRRELTEFYKQYFGKYRQPNWSDQQFNTIIQENVEYYVRDVLKLDDTNGTFAWSLNTGSSDPSNGRLRKYCGVAVNLDFAGNYSKFKNSKVENVKEKFKPIGCDSPRATMDHELGHEIDRIVSAAGDPVINQMYQEMIRKNNAEEALSGYSKSSIYEFIAEGYSEYRNNPNPRKLATDIYKRLIELRNIKVGGVKNE